MLDKAKLSLLGYQNSFLKEEFRSKNLMAEKLLDLNSDKINVQKPSEQSNIHKVNLIHRSNELNEKKFDTYHRKSPKAPIRDYKNIHNNVSKKRVTVIRDSIVKFVKSKNLVDENRIANIQTSNGFTTENIADYINRSSE